MPEPPPRQTTVDPITDPAKVRRILDFEQIRWHRSGDKVAAIKDQFGLTEIGYFQQLNGILDHPAAAAHAPLLVNRLLRLRQLRGHRHRR